MKLCKLCQTEMEYGQFKYCKECRSKWKSPKDTFYYLKRGQVPSYKKIACERSKKWQREHKEYVKSKRQKDWLELQYNTLSFYSNSDTPKCICCGENNIKVLALDHIHNDGKKDPNRAHSPKVYKTALELKDKTQYQTLCYNCNWKKNLANLQSKWKQGRNNVNQRKTQQKRKYTCIAHYSNNTNKCCNCGNGDLEVLCLDHIDNNGNIQRKEIMEGKNKGGKGMHKWIVHNNFPAGFQVLCCNCNILKHRQKGTL